MSELIWVGNTLLPRGIVFGTAILIAVIVVFAFCWATRER